MNKKLFEKYADLKRQEKEITEKIDVLKVEVLKEMQDSHVEEVSLDDAVITIGVRRAYKYPVRIVKMEEELKAEKKIAEAKGEATVIENPYPIFKEIKS